MLSDWQCIVAQLLAEGGLVCAVFLTSLGKRGVTISLSIYFLKSLLHRPNKVKSKLRASDGNAVDNTRSNVSVSIRLDLVQK